MQRMGFEEVVRSNGDGSIVVHDAQGVTSTIPIFDGQSREDLCQDALRQSAAASACSGVDIRQLTTNAELRDCAAIFDAIWQPGSGASLIGAEVLQALTTSGSYVTGALSEGQLLGACVGFWGPPDSRTMYSHIAGVASDARGRNLGFALKLNQRASSLKRRLTQCHEEHPV